jgi:hypothetical protein
MANATAIKPLQALQARSHSLEETPMNRRNFLKTLVGAFAALPIAKNIKLTTPKPQSVSQWGQLNYTTSTNLTIGQMIAIGGDGKVYAYSGESPPIGLATRDIREGETITFSLNGGMADVVSRAGTPE